ncbi:radial spoke head protein 3 homolog B isoform X1 [Bombyx mandarina]|uniref:Radial spoke head protein 3 homolog B isoform X1 n=1 Tax=Bombyx mandarina TaxID=7092 RepID=A0A6J2JAW9_BOMMA|nr:radial spoke head protein 3 homolog B isoform X1 [Bombyx mandarina]
MPPGQLTDEATDAFTIINHDDVERSDGDVTIVENLLLPKNVNIVKPLQRDEDCSPLDGTTGERVTGSMAAPVAPQTILDPKFTRALDFKLRRLKDKEILQANLRRPTRYKPRNGMLTSSNQSNPNISTKEHLPNGKLSHSHPRIDIIPPENGKKLFPKIDKSPSPGQKSRSKNGSESDKPRFITTVKTGTFLLPPPEVATLLGLETLYPKQEREKIVYSYASKPKALTFRAKRAVPEKREEILPNGGPNVPIKRPNAGEMFSGVRALIAGVVGISNLAGKPQNGSITTNQNQNTNLMHDKRVVRGSTYASHPQAAGDGVESAAARAARTRRRALAKRAAAARLRPGTPPPAPGRRHHPIQTEYYLEELFDKGVEMEVGVQTDLFLDRPATPIYVPAKTGADASTQIYPGELFDFDLEVQPILEVLIGKTTEQALAEVAQEEELATLREQQRRYCELRDAERAERQRLAAQHLRLHEEKERRVTEAEAAQIAAIEARERTAAAVLVQGYIAELLPSVLAGLRDQGYLVERIERGVDEEFMPWLVKEVSLEIESIITSRDVITEIVRDVVEARGELYRNVAEREENEQGRNEPEDSITPPSAVSEEGEEEHLEE